MQDRTTYNAAADLIERNLAAGRGAKPAFIDDRGQCSYAEIAERVRRFANVLRQLDVHPEQRILVCLHDSIDFPTAFLGAITVGVVPVAVNTQLSPEEFAFMLADSRARAVVVSAPALRLAMPVPAWKRRAGQALSGILTLGSAFCLGFYYRRVLFPKSKLKGE